MYGSARVAVVLLARMGSRRLGDKMLLPFGPRTVLESAHERLAACATVDDLVLATTDDPRDNRIAERGRKLGSSVLRGSTDDVVARMRAAVLTLPERPDVLVRGCADNPLVMPSVVDAAVRELVDTGADVVTPFEHATYPFGYGLVAMTTECLERIDREARAPAYREHVENFALEHPERYAVRTQVAPPELEYPELVLTLDYLVDLVRLERYREWLQDVPLERQPLELLQRVRGAHCFLEWERPGERLAPGHGWDLVVASACPEEVGAPRGALTVDRVTVGGEERWALRYTAGSGPEFPREPVWVDARDNTRREAPGEWLARVGPGLVPLLLGGPVRPATLQEACAPPAQKRVQPAARRGFRAPTDALFPPEVCVRLAPGGAALEDALLARLADELERHPVERVWIDAPAELEARVDALLARLGPELVSLGAPPAADPLEAAFRRVELDARGRVRTAGDPRGAPLGEAGLAGYWRSNRLRRARARLVNGEAPA